MQSFQLTCCNHTFSSLHPHINQVAIRQGHPAVATRLQSHTCMVVANSQGFWEVAVTANEGVATHTLTMLQSQLTKLQADSVIQLLQSKLTKSCNHIATRLQSHTCVGGCKHIGVFEKLQSQLTKGLKSYLTCCNHTHTHELQPHHVIQYLQS
jgi:hypothetical protein